MIFIIWDNSSSKKSNPDPENDWDDFNQDIYSDDEKVFQVGELEQQIDLQRTSKKFLMRYMETVLYKALLDLVRTKR